MTEIIADLVSETSSTTGTGTYDLAGAVAANLRTFVAGVGDTNTCYYRATNGTDEEIGYGTVIDAATDTLSRDTIVYSTNGNNAVDWPAGTKIISMVTPAELFNLMDVRGSQQIPIFAGALTPNTTDGATLNSTELGTNDTMITTMDFTDSADSFAQFDSFLLGQYEDGATFTAIFFWSHAAGASTFVAGWGLELKAIGNDDGLDGAWGTQVVTEGTGGTADDLYASPPSAAITAANSPVAGDWLKGRIMRDVSVTSNLDADARLHGMILIMQIDRGNAD